MPLAPFAVLRQTASLLILASTLALSGCTRSDEAQPPPPSSSVDLPPTARFTVTPTDSGSGYAFDARASEDPEAQPLAYAWSFGEGTLDSSAVASHVFAAPGSYTVMLRVTDAAGQTHVVEQTIDVQAEAISQEQTAAVPPPLRAAGTVATPGPAAPAAPARPPVEPDRGSPPSSAPSDPAVSPPPARPGRADGLDDRVATAAGASVAAASVSAEPTSTPPIVRAQALREAGDPRGALAVLDAVPADDAARYAQAQVLTGTIYQMELGDYEAAADAWRRSLAVDPRTYAAHYNLALLYVYDRPAYARAIMHAREVERRQPVIPPERRVEVLQTMGWIIADAEYKLFGSQQDPVERRKYGRRARHSLLRFLDATDRAETFAPQRAQADAAIAEIEAWLRSN